MHRANYNFFLIVDQEIILVGKHPNQVACSLLPTTCLSFKTNVCPHGRRGAGKGEGGRGREVRGMPSSNPSEVAGYYRILVGVTGGGTLRVADGAEVLQVRVAKQKHKQPFIFSRLTKPGTWWRGSRLSLSCHLTSRVEGLLYIVRYTHTHKP